MSSLAPLFDLLTFKAFTPDPLDPTYAMSGRLAKEKSILALSVGGAGVVGHRARVKGKRWEISPTDKIEGPYLTQNLLEQGRDIAHSNIVAVSFTPANLLCELESGRLPDDASIQKAMLTNPRSLLRNRYEQDRRYQLVASGDRKKYISFSVTTREAMALEKLVKDSGMEIARIQIGLANLTEFLARRIEVGRRDGSPRLVLIGDQSMILSMSIKDGVWDEPFSFISRTSTGAASDTASVLEYLQSLAMEIDEPGVEFHLIHSSNCWWVEAASKWFEEQAGRFILKKNEDVHAMADLQLLLDN